MIDPRGASSIEESFSYAQWTPNTRLKLCNVTWDASYRDVVRFASRDTQEQWFAGVDGVTVEHATMHKFGQPVLLEIPFNEASRFNYLIAYNDYPQLEAPRYWYYFIQSVEYVNAHTTKMVIMLDVWQSFMWDWAIGRSYITRGHIGVANENAFEWYGRDYLTYPEGLDTGANMHIVDQKFAPLLERMPYMDGSRNNIILSYGVVVVMTTDLSRDAGTVDAPKLNTAMGSFFENCASGTSMYYIPNYFRGGSFVFSVLSRMSWVGQGVVKIYMVPAAMDEYIKKSSIKLHTILGRELPDNVEVYDMFSGGGTAKLRNPNAIVVHDFRDAFQLPERYRNLKKMLTYPYCAVEMTCNNGQSLVLRPELIPSNDLTVKMAFSITGVNSRIQYYIPRYNTGAQGIVPFKTYDGEDALVPLDGGEQFAMSVGVQDIPSFMTVNNGAALALANSAYTRAFSQQSAAYSQTKAQWAADNTRSQAGASIDYNNKRLNASTANNNAMNDIASNQMAVANNIAMNQMSRQSNLAQMNNAASTLGGVLGSAASGNLGGALSSLAGGAMSAYTQSQSLDIQQDAAQANLNNSLSANAARTTQTNNVAATNNSINNQQTKQFADMNYELAQRTISGDYANTIAGINAQVQQMELTPPATAGQAGGDIFNLSNGLMGLQLKFKTCERSAWRAAGEYFLRYGYYIQRFLQPPSDLRCMSNFTYWQMSEAYVRGVHMPEQYRLAIKGILEGGTTVWSRPEDIGLIDYADNEPLPGISY